MERGLEPAAAVCDPPAQHAQRDGCAERPPQGQREIRDRAQHGKCDPEDLALHCFSLRVRRVNVAGSTSTQTIHLATVSLGRLVLGQRLAQRHGFAFRRNLEPQGFTFLCLAIQRLRDCRRATHFAQPKDFDVKQASIAGDPQHVADADLAGRFGALSARVNPAQLAGFSRE